MAIMTTKPYFALGSTDLYSSPQQTRRTGQYFLFCYADYKIVEHQLQIKYEEKIMSIASKFQF